MFRSVDWAGVNVFQAGRGKNFSSMPDSTCVLSFAEIAAKKGFPVLIAEALPRFYGTRNGAASWDGWFQPLFETLFRQPAVKGFSYIDRDCRANGTRTKCVGGLWGDARIEPAESSYVGEKYQQAISNPSIFVHAGTLAATCDALGVQSCSSRQDPRRRAKTGGAGQRNQN